MGPGPGQDRGTDVFRGLDGKGNGGGNGDFCLHGQAGLEYGKGMAVQRTQAMTRERWGQIKSAFEAALARPVAEREECIRSLCGTDSELESEVKALLEANDSAQSFLQAPAAAVIGYVPPDGAPRTLAPGEVLAGRFEIVSFLNRGGMGEVYEAWDRELKDHIALKTIRPEIASSPAVLER